MANTDIGTKGATSADQLLVKQVARKLYALHSKKTNGTSGFWGGASQEERKFWWSMAKSAVHLVKKSGLTGQ